MKKHSGRVAIEAGGKIALEWTDTGEAGGPPRIPMAKSRNLFLTCLILTALACGRASAVEKPSADAGAKDHPKTFNDLLITRSDGKCLVKSPDDGKPRFKHERPAEPSVWAGKGTWHKGEES